MVFLEVGAGDCALSFAVAAFVKQVYAVDVSAEITRAASVPANFKLILSDGCSIDVPEGSVHLAYSNQLMEHLHPDDAFEQLRNIHRALAPGGVYICSTPNRLNGPHDVSRYFSDRAGGFHLREYTTSELSQIFRSAGFSKVGSYIGVKGVFTQVPSGPLALFERTFSVLPHKMGQRLGSLPPFRQLLDIRLAGVK
jgi:SAM-dependent methyltransferase